MKYRVIFKKSAEKELFKLPVSIITQIDEIIQQLKVEPRPFGCKKLKGFSNYYRIRKGDYRVIYSIYEEVLVVEIISVGNRKNIYE